jgi:hypothetical protein
MKLSLSDDVGWNSEAFVVKSLLDDNLMTCSFIFCTAVEIKMKLRVIHNDRLVN